MTVLGLISGTSTRLNEVIAAHVVDKITKGLGGGGGAQFQANVQLWLFAWWLETVVWLRLYRIGEKMMLMERRAAPRDLKHSEWGHENEWTGARQEKDLGSKETGGELQNSLAELTW